jgi:hypothetical protein
MTRRPAAAESSALAEAGGASAQQDTPLDAEVTDDRKMGVAQAVPLLLNCRITVNVDPSAQTTWQPLTLVTSED